MKFCKLLVWISILVILVPFSTLANPAESKSPFKIVDLTRDIRSRFFDQAPGVSVYNGKSNLGMGLRIVSRIQKYFGVIWGINAEMEQNKLSASTDPSLTYDLNAHSYLLTGITYAFLDSDWGYQLGAGYRPHQQWGLELIQRQINQREDSLNLRATYYFN